MKTQTKAPHTPGPWHYVRRSLNYNISSESKNICRIQGSIPSSTTPDQDTLEANARLIAAAPTMLKSLQKLETAFALNYDRQTMISKGHLQRIRWAIAKATSEKEPIQ